MQAFFMVILFAVIWVVIYSALAMFVWNWTIPNIFVGGPHIDLWQAFGLVVLGNLLTGGGSVTTSSSK
jgi:hypothetical protein